MMVEHYLKLEKAVSSVLIISKKEKHRSLVLTAEETVLAGKVPQILEPFKAATSQLEGGRYCTMSLVFPIMFHLLYVRRAEDRKTVEVKSLATGFVSELDER